jgi:hypothetical protein
MSYIKKYLQSAQNGAHERFLSADGFVDNDLQFTAEGNFFGADGVSMSSAPTSQPYIITVSNASGVSVSNFDVLGAYIYLQNAGFSNGSLTINGVTISSAISNVTYQQFLYQTTNSPFTVGLTYIEAITVNSQVTSVLTLNTQDANGNQALKPLVPTIDPYQFQSGTIALKQMYRIDGYTRLTIANILPNAVFRLHFYPTDNINLARGLAGNTVSRSFSDPKIVKDSTVVVKG